MAKGAPLPNPSPVRTHDGYVRAALATWDGADADTRAAGVAWYPDFRRFCAREARRFGVTTATYAAVFAATSPTTSYAGNLTITAAVLRGRGWRVDDGANVMPAHLPAVVVASLAARQRPGAVPLRPLDHLRGPKVRAFYGAIMGHSRGECVIDRHVARALRDEFGVKARYSLMSGAVREAARRRGLADDPHGFQAALWVAARGFDAPRRTTSKDSTPPTESRRA